MIVTRKELSKERREELTKVIFDVVAEAFTCKSSCTSSNTHGHLGSKAFERTATAA
jgi:hypothetical protein